MDSSLITLFFAKAFGIYFIVIAISLFLNPDRFKEMYKKFLEDDCNLILGGVIALLLGAFIIASHNVWVANWPVLITILGYWAVIKGAGLLFYPNFIQLFRGIIDASDSTYRIIGIVWGVIGLFFLYQGFWA